MTAGMQPTLATRRELVPLNVSSGRFSYSHAVFSGPMVRFSGPMVNATWPKRLPTPPFSIS